MPSSTSFLRVASFVELKCLRSAVLLRVTGRDALNADA